MILANELVIKPGLRKIIISRFESKYIPEPNSGCWLWIGASLALGRGVINIEGRRIIAARLSHALFIAPVPLNKHVLHRCDIPSCVNPDHLYLGIHTDNMKDMRLRGRDARGEAMPHAKLNSKLVINICEEYAKGATLISLEKKFGVSRNVIKGVILGKRWKHVNGLIPQPIRSLERARGEKSPNAKLKEEQVKEILRLYAAGTAQIDLAKQFNITPTTIYRIVRRLSWVGAVT